MNLAEILAKKRAAKEAEERAKLMEEAVAIGDAIVAREKEEASKMEERQLPSPVAATEEAQAQVPEKPLTFAEKMALKKAQAAQTESKTPNSTTGTASAPTVIQDKKEDTAEGKVEAPSMVAAAAESSKESPVATPVKVDTGKPSQVLQGQDTDPEAAQAYADIKAKLDTLAELSGIALEGAMKDLKKSLMQNPSAVSLMEDSDIGQLVIALRKITGEAIAEASKEKSPGRKKAINKNVDLSDADAVAAIFNEL